MFGGRRRRDGEGSRGGELRGRRKFSEREREKELG